VHEAEHHLLPQVVRDLLTEEEASLAPTTEDER
jgi:hypothetical protein